MTRVLLLSCSCKKHPDSELLPANQRYRGPIYQSIAKMRRERIWPPDVQIGIVSAEYALIEETTLLPPYNHIMTQSRARELQPRIGQLLDAFLARCAPERVCVLMGKRYRESIAGSQILATLSASGQVDWVYADGIASMRSHLRNWLLSQEIVPSTDPPHQLSPAGQRPCQLSEVSNKQS